uniref:Uncharacterized protein n=1 Tax=Anguilla anguilla TaxID=7936 RepID=A0A0E9SU98_ANGAN
MQMLIYHFTEGWYKSTHSIERDLWNLLNYYLNQHKM